MGVGSSLRSDDAAGIYVAEKLRNLALPGVDVLIGETAPENLTGELRRLQPSHVLFVDAADLGEQPGVVRLFSSQEAVGVSSSTHTLPMSVIADYLRQELGCQILILGLQPKSLEFGGTISDQVAEAVDETVAAIARALS